MRHARSGKKLGRDSAHRKALYSNLAGALIEHGRIQTTVAKAKAVKPIAEQMITLGRRGDLHARRQATAYLRSRDVVHKLFAEVAPRFADRPGGYSRIVKLGPRQGDAAEMAYLELVDFVPAGASAAAPSAPAPAKRRRLRGGRQEQAPEFEPVVEETPPIEEEAEPAAEVADVDDEPAEEPEAPAEPAEKP
jgi:large subunit ribosomal protein L17